MRPYRQARIWAYLREHPGATPRAIRIALRLTNDGANQALQRMKAEGTARREGASWQSAWYALGEVAPVDGRGQAPGSIKAFARERREHWRANLEKAAEVTGRKGRPIGQIDTARLNRSCELARLWKPVHADASIANRDEP